jgi:tryptophan aminotransferase
MVCANTPLSLQAASITQVLALALLRHWGHEGFLTHTSKASDFYRRKRDVFVAAAERHLRGKATWEVPTAGMFLWINLLLPPGQDSFEVLNKSAIAAGVIAVPGMAFMPSKSKTSQLRASFSLVTEEGADEACRRIAVLIDHAFAEAAKGEPAVV